MTHPSSRNRSWWRRWLHGPRPRPAVRRRPRLEVLEDRLAPTAQLVADVNLNTLSSHPGNFLVLGTTFFFTATDPVHGSELWRSDGTETGTVLVKDIRPGSGSSSVNYLTNVNGTLFFRANDGTSGNELWRSDGTDSGTLRVKDIRPGIGGVNGTGKPDVIVGMSRNGSQMKVFDGDRLLLGKLKVLVNKVVSPVSVIKGGVFVAAGNIDGDARIDIIVGLGAGGKSNVFVFEDASDANAKAAQRKKSAPNYGAYKGGVRVAAVDVTGDGKVEVLMTAGAGLNPYRLRVLDGLALTLLDTLFTQAPDLTEGRFLAVGP
jgi:ELWxxDGT repeat protein